MRRRTAARAGRPSLLGTAARTAVISGTATATSNRVAGRQQQRAVPPPATSAAPTMPPQAVEAPPVQAPAPSVTDELVDQLHKLAELRDAGILSEEEFAAKKAQLLGI